MSRAKSKENEFYDMLRELAADVGTEADLFARVPREWPESRRLIPAIAAAEIRCDGDEARVQDALNTSFITPFDREDVDALARQMGEICDIVESTAARFDLFNVHKIVPEAQQMCDLIRDAAREMHLLFEHFSDFRRDPSVREHARQIQAIEDRGDVVYRDALAHIFNEPDDPIHVLKWKSLLDPMEEALDLCKDVADTVLAIVMKNA